MACCTGFVCYVRVFGAVCSSPRIWVTRSVHEWPDKVQAWVEEIKAGSIKLKLQLPELQKDTLVVPGPLVRCKQKWHHGCWIEVQGEVQLCSKHP